MSISHETADRTDDQLTCPVDDCSYRHDSVQGIMAHVGHHERGWDGTTATPEDVKTIATINDGRAFDSATRVLAYFAKNGATSDAIRAFYDAGYGTIQVRVGEIGLDEWEAFQDATDVDGVRYVGEGRWYCTEEFVHKLPEAIFGAITGPVACGKGGCTKTDDLETVSTRERGTRTLCSRCRKEHLGVST